MEGNTDITTWVLDYVKKDFIILLVCLLCLLACVYTIYQTKQYKIECNEHWLQQIKEARCCYNCLGEEDMFMDFNVSFSLVPKYGDKNINNNSTGIR